MVLHFNLNENDYLTYQLYVASKSPVINRRRQRGKILFPILYSLMGSYGFYQKDFVYGGIFFSLSILWFLLYPIWEKGYYLKHYKSFVKENYTSILDKKFSLEFSENHIITKSEESQSQLNYSEFEGFAELPTAFLIQIRGGKAVILPKDKVSNHDEIRETLENLANRLQVPFIDDKNWVWK